MVAHWMGVPIADRKTAPQKTRKPLEVHFVTNIHEPIGGCGVNTAWSKGAANENSFSCLACRRDAGWLRRHTRRAGALCQPASGVYRRAGRGGRAERVFRWLLSTPWGVALAGRFSRRAFRRGAD